MSTIITDCQARENCVNTEPIAEAETAVNLSTTVNKIEVLRLEKTKTDLTTIFSVSLWIPTCFTEFLGRMKRSPSLCPSASMSTRRFWRQRGR